MSSAKKGMSLPEALERGDQVSPTAVLEWTLERFSPRVLMTTAFGLNGVALIHMTHALDPNLPVLFIDTGFHFPETLETKDRIVERYGLNLIEYRVPPPPEGQGEPSREGPSPETPELCCAERKVETFQRALADLEPDALISARSQYQSETRRELAILELESHPVRVNPLADWSLEEVERYVQDHGIPYNPLYDRGYKSVGCWPCTQPVSPEEGIRDGRWSGQDKQECGIWFVNGTVSRQPPPGEPDHERGDDDGR